MEMDIYMRRRLVALGGLVAFFILFVLLVKSCGDDDTAPLSTAPSGATGEDGTTALTTEEFIDQADGICAQANSAVGGLDPTDPNAVRDEFRITRDELERLQSLEVEDQSRTLTRFFAALEDVVSALQAKQAATRAGDAAAADEAQLAIDEAEVEARELGDRYGFRDCGQFLDAGEAPGGDEADTGAGTEAAPPADTGGVAPPETTPPDDTGTAPPDDTGGDGSGDTGGITP